MNILVVNAGSSSLKYQLVDNDTNTIIRKGLCERVGSIDSFHKHGVDEDEVVHNQPLENHHQAMELVLDSLVNGENAPLSSLSEISAVGHRIVHGGEYFDKSVLITPDVLDKIAELSEIAPLHNPPSLSAINACRELMPDIHMVAVFDTSFFQSLPPKAFMYPIPYEYYEKYGIRKYGFHGTSHRYLAMRAADILDEDLEDLRIITCHLGNGCSVSAIDHGVPIDTSMGFTPLDGLMMGTRSGSIDPAIPMFLMAHENMDAMEANNMLNKESGLLGISGISNDMRDLTEAANEGNERAILAFEMYAASVRKYISQYLGLMVGADAIVLSGGVGENSQQMRSMIFAGWQPLGLILDPAKNRQRGFERIISHERSLLPIIVIPTDEEHMIAQDTYDIVKSISQIVPISFYQNED